MGADAIYESTDFALSFQKTIGGPQVIGNLPNAPHWQGIASSGDGRRLVVAAVWGDIWVNECESET
jgi:hypothetical protein